MRNQLISIILLCFFSSLYSQSQFETKIDSMLVNIDKTTLTSNFLYDRVTNTAGLSSFNLTINTSHVKHFEQSLLELYKASKEQKFISYRDLRKLTSPDSLQNVVDVGIINASFHTINYNEEDENEGSLKLITDSFQKLNNNNPPFIEEHVLVASPLKLYLKGENVIFNFDQQFIFEDTQSKDIVSLSVNFDTETDYTIIQNGNIINSSVIINYNTDGNKIITLTAIFEDGSTKTTASVVSFTQFITPPSNSLIENYTQISSTSFTGYAPGSVPINGYLEYRIYYHTNDGNQSPTLLKPIIIVDGFDPGDKRKIEDSDPHPELSNPEHRSIREIMTYTKADGSPGDLTNELRELGYDVVIVNHPNYTRNNVAVDGGADYIERNALTHSSLYQSLNAKLIQNGSNEELVIVGPSMGGLISRYALAYMEKNNIPHNTRLWISVDSPHLGANIPIGIQALVNALVDNTESPDAEDFVYNQLGSPAAKQQLIEQYTYESNDVLDQAHLDNRTQSQGFAIDRGSMYFKTFYDSLFENGLPQSKGYPQNLRKVTIVNGSLTNSNLYYNPFMPLAHELNNGNVVLDNYPNPGSQTFKVEGDAYVLGHIVTMESYGMPDFNEYHKVSFFKQYSFGWDYYDAHTTNINSRGNLDNVPGGWFPTQQVLAKSVHESSPCENFIVDICVNDWDIHSLKHSNSFIPTASALGLLNPDTNWGQSFNKNLVCDGEIPFDNYYGPKLNEQHTSFTQSSVDWLMEELDGDTNYPQPSVYLNPTDIQGPGIICHDDIVTYDLDLCSALNTVWEASPNLEIAAFDSVGLTVYPKSFVDSQYGAQGFIKATIGEEVVIRNIWVGLPTTPEDIEGPETIHVGSTNNYSTDNGGGAQSYKWSLPQPFDPATAIVTSIDPTQDYWQMLEIYAENKRNNGVFSGNGGYEGEISVIGVNSCGEGLYAATLAVEQNNSGPCITCYDPIQVVPVPNSADEEFKLDFAQHPPGTYYIYIFDTNSNIMYQGETENYKKTVDTTDLPNGIYYLHIHDGNEVTSQQLYIQH